MLNRSEVVQYTRVGGKIPFLKYAKPALKCVARSAPKIYLSRLPFKPSCDHLRQSRATKLSVYHFMSLGIEKLSDLM